MTAVSSNNHKVKKKIENIDLGTINMGYHTEPILEVLALANLRILKVFFSNSELSK